MLPTHDMLRTANKYRQDSSSASATVVLVVYTRVVIAL